MGGTTRAPKSLTPLRPATAAQEQSGWVYYHGTPDERTWDQPHGAAYGLHVGSEEAARQALNARIGKPLEGDWDGTREYGKTLLSPYQTTGQERNLEAPRYPSGNATYSTGHKVPMDARPSIFPVRIVGPMLNHPAIPVEDDYANSRMHGQITRGQARRGYFYRNAGEDYGSISAVVPSAAHLERVHPPREASRWAPSAGIFGPTTGLDPLLFDEDGQLRPGVRHDVMTRLDQCIRVDSGLAGSDWQDWTRVYILGGSASEWAGDRPNEKARDLDVIVAIDLAAAQGYSAFEGMSAGEAASALNTAFRKRFNADGWKPDFGGTWNLTAFCNQRAWDIAAIRPYAAYDLTDMHWVTIPPHLPQHSVADFDPAVIAQAKAVAAEARAILKLPEPLRTREATALWERLHAGRDAAFSDQGEGWSDPGNVTEKWLAYAPRHLLENIKELALAPKTAAWDSSGSDNHGVYLRFGDWPHDERSFSPAGGYHEEGVSVYDLDREGDPAIGWEGEHGNDPEEEMRGRRSRAEKNRYYGSDSKDSVGHLVKGEMSGVGYDGEPLLKNVRRVGDWIDHRHLFIDTAGAHRLARDPLDEDYEEPEETPPYGYRNQHTAAAEEHPLPNQATGGVEWYHGSDHPEQFDRFDPSRSRYAEEEGEGTGRWWNSRLGPHFTSQHHVATELSQNMGEGHVYHARLNIKSPMRYPSESAMAHHGAEWARDNGYGRAALNEALKAGRGYDTALNEHPQSEEIASGFRDHLRRSGFDGITYGNEFEGGYGHESAIAFHPDQVHITSAHPNHEPGLCNQVTECPQCHEADVERSEPYCWNCQEEVDLRGHRAAVEKTADTSRLAPWMQWTAAEPHKAVINRAQGDFREEHPEFTRPLDGTDWSDPDASYFLRGQDSREGTQAMRKILRAAGHPGADRAWVGLHPDPKNVSQVAVDSQTGALGAVLLPSRWDLGTVAHEGAHLVHAHETGIDLGAMAHGEHEGSEIDTGVPDHVMHGPEFSRHLANALDVISPGAGDDFLRHRQNAVGLVGNVRARFHKLPREFEGGEPIRREAAAEEPSYRQPHQGPDADDGEALHELGSRGFFPPDVYDRPHDYGGDPATWQKMRDAKGDPERRVVMYRAMPAPHHKINPGDWVTLSKEYALQHAQESDGDHYAVLKKQVRAKDLRNDGNDLHEWTYHGPVQHFPGLEYRGGATNGWKNLRALQKAQEADQPQEWKDADAEAARQDRAVDRSRKRDESAAMVYLHVPPGTLHAPQGGEAHHHVTLAYLPKSMSDEDFERVSGHVRDIAARHAPFKGTFAGHETFPEGADRFQKRTSYVPLHSPAAHALHADLAHLSRARYDTFAPHATLAYLRPGDRNPDPHPEVAVPFTHVHVRRGDEVRSYPLSGPSVHEAATGYTDLKPRSGMIYLDLPPGTVRQVPGGVDDHHITVVYLGSDVSDEAFAEACRRTEAAAASLAPMDGVLRGIDIFPPSGSSEGKVPAFVPAYVGSVGLLRRALEDLSASEHKDWKPHVTLAYLEEGDSLPAPHPAVPMRFDRVHVKRGDDIRSFPLAGQLRKGAAYEDVTDEARAQRRRRVDRFLDRAENNAMTMHVRDKWAEPVHNSYIHGIMEDHSGGHFPDEHWEHLPDQEVSLRQKIHQHQGYVYPEAVREKVRQDFEDDDPWAYEGDYEAGGSDPKFVKHEGETYLVDGHHRFARARLMGHSSMWGKVFDTSNPDHDPRNCYECNEDREDEDEW